jgi:hypothetical protein
MQHCVRLAALQRQLQCVLYVTVQLPSRSSNQGPSAHINNSDSRSIGTHRSTKATALGEQGKQLLQGLRASDITDWNTISTHPTNHFTPVTLTPLFHSNQWSRSTASMWQFSFHPSTLPGLVPGTLCTHQQQPPSKHHYPSLHRSHCPCRARETSDVTNWKAISLTSQPFHIGYTYIGFIDSMHQTVCVDGLTEMAAEGECWTFVAHISRQCCVQFSQPSNRFVFLFQNNPTCCVVKECTAI